MFAKESHIPKTKSKILALHGKGSNKTITKLQLQNLELDDQDFDVTYLNGTISVPSPDSSLNELIGFDDGAWYSWLPPISEWKKLDKSVERI